MHDDATTTAITLTKGPRAIVPKTGRTGTSNYASRFFERFFCRYVRLGIVGGGVCLHHARRVDAARASAAGEALSARTQRTCWVVMRVVVLSVTIAFHLLASVVGAAAQTAAPACRGKQQLKDVAELLFGRDIGDRLGVSEAAWARFVAREMTPRFPDGLTITNATGQWRDRDSGRIVHEPSKQVEIVLPGNDDDQARLDAVVAAYKSTFHQQAVRVIVRSACVSN